MSAALILLFGYGSNIGASIAEAFKAKGYNLALVSRSISEESSTPTKLHIQADISDTGVVTAWTSCGSGNVCLLV
jgi:short-subunit dehydrogenase